MKRLLFLWPVLLLAVPLQASTQVPAVISGNAEWDSSQNPYVIQGKVEVPQGSMLRIGPGVKIVYQGVGELAVEGVIEVEGSAAAPVVFDMTQGGLRSQFVLLGGAQADIKAAKFLGGVFLARDAQVAMRDSELTKGSGVYLQGKTQAFLNNNKIYGNATGAVLDGADVKASLVFNTLVQNTYGLDLRNYAYLKLLDNSIHDNNTQALNETNGTAQLGGNYWGSLDPASVHRTARGNVDFSPLKDLKDVLRDYIMTQLPEITVKQSRALAAKERKQEKADQLAMAKLKKEAEQEAKAAAAAAAQPPAVAAAAPPAPEAGSPAPVVEAPEAVEPEAPAPTGMVAVKSLPPAAHTLTPLANLPPEQDLNLDGAASNPDENAGGSPAGTATLEPPTPEANAPAATASAPPPPPIPSSVQSAPAPAGSSDDIIPPPPDEGGTAAAANPPAAASSAPPAPPPLAVPSDNSSTPPVPPALPSDLDSVPAPPGADNPANGMSEVPPVPAASSGAVAPPAPPVATATPTPPPAPQTGRVNAGATTEIEAPSVDMSGMAPPSGSGAATAGGSASSNSAPVTSTNDLALPPIQDLDVPPPKDLDLPPSGDLGNLDLNTKK